MPLGLAGANKVVDRHPSFRLQRVIVIRTPENIELRYALAGAGSRAAAYFIDFVLMSLVGQLLINLLAYFIASLVALFSGEGTLWIGAVVTLLLFMMYNCYFMLFEWLLSGQTPGKRLMHIRVIKDGGYALRFFDTLVRNLLRVVDFIPLFYGVGLTSLLLTRNSQRLGDLAAGTLVVHQDQVLADSLLPALPAAPLAEPLPADKLSAVPVALLSLIGQFLARLDLLAPRARHDIATDLVDLVRRSSGLRPQAGQSSEGFLGIVFNQAEQIRSSSAPVAATA